MASLVAMMAVNETLSGNVFFSVSLFCSTAEQDLSHIVLAMAGSVYRIKNN